MHPSEHVIRLASFDVFDTCITRHFAFPRDLFFELGMRLAPAHLSVAAKHRFATTFQQRRIRAEKRANKQTGPKRSATLIDIYELFRPLDGLHFPTSALVEAEIALERESVFPVAEIANEVAKRRMEGSRIVFVSDMYLPANVLEEMLSAAGVMIDGDVLYVSCDAGRTKHTGELFEHVLAKEGIASFEMFHTGDNLWADVRAAHKAGLGGRHFTQTTLTERERKIAGRREPRSQSMSFLAALSRRLRLSLHQMAIGTQALDSMICSVVVPFLLAYVEWVLEQARKTGIRRLYFVARDGEVLFRIAKELVGPSGPELRYLYGSRQAWVPPSITRDTSDWKRLLATGGHANSRRDILARAGLDAEASSAIQRLFEGGQSNWEHPLRFDEAQRFIAELISNPVTAQIVFDSSEKKRETALQYLEQEGLFDDVLWALVDTGWGLNSQAALRRILDASGRRHNGPVGYYMALEPSRLPPSAAGDAHAFVGRTDSMLPRRRFVVEHCFTASSHPTTRGYAHRGQSIVPVLGEELRGERELTYAARLGEIAAGAARTLARDASARRLLLRYREGVIRNAEQFLRRPPRIDAQALASFGAVADLRHEKRFVSQLAPSLSIHEVWILLRMNFSRKLRLNRAHLLWLEGSVAVSRPLVRTVLSSMLWVKSLFNEKLARKPDDENPTI